MNLDNFYAQLKASFARDSQYLVNTVAISFIVMALIFAFKPYLGNDPKLAEIQRLDRNLVTVHADDMRRIVQSQNGKPVMLVMYASWCGYCKRIMPMLVDMMRNHQLDQVNPVFLSVDDQPRMLSKYLVHKGYNTAFTPYRFDHDVIGGSYSDFFYESGSHYRGSIPYIGFFSSNGRMISDASGVVSRQDVIDVINKIMKLQN